MFANTFQSGFLSIFYSVGSNPLQLWDKQVKNGHIRRVVDDEVRSLVLEISGTNVATTYITCPIKPRVSLGIKLPFLVMIIKNMKKYFTFEIQILDDKDMHRRFRVSNFQSTTKVRPFCTTMPIGLSAGWNQVQFNLADFTKRAYGSTYLETTRVQIHANVRIRRIYFSDMLYTDDELPNEYKLFLPTPGAPAAQKPTKAPPEKKQPAAKEKKETKVAPVQPVEEEPPSAAPPSPTGVEETIPTTPETVPEVAEPITEETTTVEPASEEPTTTEPTTVELTEEAPSEAAPEEPKPPAENELFVEAVEELPAEEAPPAETTEGAESASADQPAVVEEAPPAEDEAVVEEAPPAEGEAVGEEAPPEEPPAEEEAPAEEPPEEEKAESAVEEAT